MMRVQPLAWPRGTPCVRQLIGVHGFRQGGALRPRGSTALLVPGRPPTVRRSVARVADSMRTTVPGAGTRWCGRPVGEVLGEHGRCTVTIDLEAQRGAHLRLVA